MRCSTWSDWRAEVPDVKVDVGRGADTAVRLTHLPTGTVVTVDAADHGASVDVARREAFRRLAGMLDSDGTDG